MAWMLSPFYTPHTSQEYGLAVAALAELGITTNVGKGIVIAIAKGKIPNVAIKY